MNRLGGDGGTGKVQLLPLTHEREDEVLGIQIASGESLNVLGRQPLNVADLRLPVAIGEPKEFPVEEECRNMFIRFS